MIVFKFNKSRLRFSFNLLKKINIINKTVIISGLNPKKNRISSAAPRVSNKRYT